MYRVLAPLAESLQGAEAFTANRGSKSITLKGILCGCSRLVVESCSTGVDLDLRLLEIDLSPRRAERLETVPQSDGHRY